MALHVAYLLGIGKVIGSMLRPNRIIAKDVKRCQMRDIYGINRGPQTDTTKYQALLELPDKGLTIKVLVVCMDWDLGPLDLLNSLALGCYQPSPEVLIIIIKVILLVAMGRRLI